MISDRWVALDPDPGDLITDAVYHHNGDYSGEVWITVPDSAIEPTVLIEPGLSTVKLPMALIKDIAARWVRRELKDRLAEADDDTLLLGGPWQEGRFA